MVTEKYGCSIHTTNTVTKTIKYLNLTELDHLIIVVHLYTEVIEALQLVGGIVVSQKLVVAGLLQLFDHQKFLAAYKDHGSALIVYFWLCITWLWQL